MKEKNNLTEIFEEFSKVFEVVEKIHSPFVSKQKDFSLIKDNLKKVCEKGKELITKLNLKNNELENIT
ncbi:MAG: hypothetical protein N2258_04915, partial [Brevinematales bacterium]|nr:hypothetical protein [Brevinematales bacterium]